MSFFYTWGSVLGPVLAGAAYDREQSYATSLWGLCVALLIGSAMTWLLSKPWKMKIENG
jgi:MFS-type transporter involved in bile tolerance (Atg22 family)